MKRLNIEQLSKPVSRLVLGVDHQSELRAASPQFDGFLAAGGNTFDTAWVYGKDGACERTFGQYVAQNGCREQIVILGKGGHTPWCNRRDIINHLDQSLERLQTEYLDIYMLHRDNLELTPSAFIDVFDEIKNSGKARTFGVSNWSHARIDEANRYARETGKPQIAALSNQFSLARLIEPPWDGCVSSSDDPSQEWLVREQIPLFAWSSQAHGFFAGFARPENRDPAHLARCWYSEDNLLRLERAEQLAQMKSDDGLPLTAVNIALAYVLCQPFPTLALIGPRSTDELSRAVKGLEVPLTTRELAWLDLKVQDL